MVFSQMKLGYQVVAVVDTLLQGPVSQEHQSQVHLSLDRANLSVVGFSFDHLEQVSVLIVLILHLNSLLRPLVLNLLRV